MVKKIKDILNDETARKIIVFFHDNPGSIDTLSGIAAWVGEGKTRTKDILGRLVSLGILDKDITGAAKGYCYTRDEKTIRSVDKLLRTYAEK